MTKTQAETMIAKLREVVEHENASEEEKDVALLRIRELKKKFNITPNISRYTKEDKRLVPIEKKRNHRVTFVLTAQEHAHLMELTSQHGISVSEYIRRRLFSRNVEPVLLSD